MASPSKHQYTEVGTGGVPTAEAQPINELELVAPSTLMGGYVLDAKIGERTVKVEVPPEGVEKGETFRGRVVDDGQQRLRSKIPVGSWKDGLCDCFNYGVCHASCCLSYWCGLLALGQIITRMELNWFGRPTSNVGSQTRAFSILAWITGTFVVVHLVLGTAIQSLKVNSVNNSANWDPNTSIYDAVHGNTSPMANTLQTIYNLLTNIYIIMVIVITYNVRSYVRSKYSIPENQDTPCKGMEDCCCAVFCHFCSTAQMLRHTGNYEENHPDCCSSTGLVDRKKFSATDPQYPTAQIV